MNIFQQYDSAGWRKGQGWPLAYNEGHPEIQSPSQLFCDNASHPPLQTPGQLVIYGNS